MDYEIGEERTFTLRTGERVTGVLKRFDVANQYLILEMNGKSIPYRFDNVLETSMQCGTNFKEAERLEEQRKQQAKMEAKGHI